MTAWLELLPIALQDALFLLGFAFILIGVLTRARGGNNEGLGLSIALVGVCMIIAVPIGKIAGWW